MHQIEHNNRRHELDWLRVMVFGLLIFYHIGMLYVADWGFHYKSEHQSSFLQNLMLLLNRWRLPLLFLISGVAIRFILDKVTWYRFIGLRSVRLLVPLFFGILVVVPPQLYVEMTANGDLNMSYWSFYKAFFDLDHPVFENYQAGILPHMDVNHLWYIRELWWFSLFMLPLSFILRLSFFDRIVSLLAWRNSALMLLFVPIIVISIVDFTFLPSSGEGRRIWMGFTFLVVGFLLAKNHSIWESIRINRHKLLLAALISYELLIYFYHTYFLTRTESALGWDLLLEITFGYFSRWSWVLVVIAYSSHYLQKTSPKLDYLNEAVYPYYILHQTILIVAAYVLTSYNLGPIIEPILIILITFSGCALGFALIRRVNTLRFLFGLKWHK